MARLDQREGRYRVVLIGVGNNSEEEKDCFCQNVSKGYHVALPQLRKIVDRCPAILKKDLSLSKAQLLAKTFASFGASVSVEEGRQGVPSISLEFQQLAPHRMALESSYLQKSQRGAWNVTGRVRNISDEDMNDTWVLIQLFEDSEEFIAFEEAPLPINPLPSGQASPFKVIFEGDLSIRKISIAFKNASGQPLPAADKRKKRGWVKTGEEEESSLFSPQMPTLSEEKLEATDFTDPLVKMILEGGKELQEYIPVPREQDVGPALRIEPKEIQGAGERVSKESVPPPDEPRENMGGSPSVLVKQDGYPGNASKIALQQEVPQDFASVSQDFAKEVVAALEGSELRSDEEVGREESRLDASVFQEATQLLKDISNSPKEREAEEKPTPSFDWMGHFRDAVETFYQSHHDIFSAWFEECRKKGEFRNSLHSLLTILVHSRFDQGTESIKALGNTQKLFQFLLEPNLLGNQLPLLEGTSFASGEIWTNLLQRALPKVQQIGNAILEKNVWNVFDLERMIQVIPHMGNQSSRVAIQWIKELIPQVVEIDLSEAPIIIGEELYRVAARLGVVDPYLDHYLGSNSMADTKIQSFARIAFPHNPARVEKPMCWMGDKEERGGHCFPVQPRCDGCLFKAFCPKLYLNFNPTEKRIGKVD